MVEHRSLLHITSASTALSPLGTAWIASGDMFLRSARKPGYRDARLETAKGCHKVLDLAGRRGLAGFEVTFNAQSGEEGEHHLGNCRSSHLWPFRLYVHGKKTLQQHPILRHDPISFIRKNSELSHGVDGKTSLLFPFERA